MCQVKFLKYLGSLRINKLNNKKMEIDLIQDSNVVSDADYENNAKMALAVFLTELKPLLHHTITDYWVGGICNTCHRCAHQCYDVHHHV